MASTSAKLAVKRRALRAATWLDLWAGNLLDELEKQTVECTRTHTCAVDNGEKSRRCLRFGLSPASVMSAMLRSPRIPPSPRA